MFSNSLVVQILDYLNHNLYKKISIEELSNLLHYNKDYIMRIFKREIHMTIIEYLNHKRIYLSLSSLKEINTSILSIAFQYGFYSQEYYCEVFHKVMGISPSEYRLFLNYSIGLQEESVFEIQNRLSNLSSFFQNIQHYLQNTPPKNTVKVLSIFKQ